MVETLVQDLRLAFRLLARTPSAAAIAVLSTGISVGATAVVFTAVRSVLLQPLPYSRPSKLVQLGTNFTGARSSHIDWVLWNDAQEITRRTRTLAAVGVYRNAVFDLGGGAHPPEALYGLRVSARLFPTLGVSPMLGRTIRPEEDQFGRPNELILSYGLWRRRFNADREIVGKKVRINGHDCLVIGVMPPDFNFPLRRAATHTPQPYVEFWAPINAGRLRPEEPQDAVGAVGRLRPGVSLNEVQQDLTSISAALAREFPALNRDHVLGAGSLSDRMLGNVGPALWFLMAAALLFLLIGCANVANLLLARSMVRRREIAIRLAIGASRSRIIRQFLTESCVLAGLGGVVAYALTLAAWRILPAVVPVSIPRLSAARADSTILLFSLAVALGNGLLFGLVPALRFSSSATASASLAIRSTLSVRRDLTRGALLIVEVALTVALVLIGGQLLGHFIALVTTDPGFYADRIVASVILPEPERYKTPEERYEIYGRFLRAARAIPGVENAGTVDALPFSGENHGGFITTNRNAAADPKYQSIAEINTVGGQYLQVLGVRLVAGRWFGEEDNQETNNVAIINDVAAQHLWPRISAIGRTFCVNCTAESPNNWKRVVGVVSSVRHADLDAPPGLNVYLNAGALNQAAFLVVRTARPAGEIGKAIRNAIASVDPDQPVLLTTSMRSLLADSVADRRFIMLLFVATGSLALMMALAGIYGVMSYIASRRTQEIGVRMAVGATRGAIHGLLFRQGFFTAGIGLAIGFGSVVVILRTLRSLVAGLGGENTQAMWIAAGLVLFTTALACWLPANRAAKSDPAAALRQE